MTKYRVAVRLG